MASSAVSFTPSFSKLKLRQRFKIAEIRLALIETGHVSLDEQAAMLGVSRSTTWSILYPSHKSSGLSAHTISRILKSPQLPDRVRKKILEYMHGKIGGLYGHTERRRREFAEGLMAELADTSSEPQAVFPAGPDLEKRAGRGC